MSICPICSAVSEGKRIVFNGYDVYDLCMKCASYSVCLISSNVDIPVKENAIRWAEREIQNNAEKMYLANCIRSWKQCAEDYVRAHTPAPVVPMAPVAEVMDIDSTEIDLDATIKGFSTGDYSAVMYEESRNSVDSSVLDVRKTDFFIKDEPEILSQPVAVPVDQPVPAPAPFSAPFSVTSEDNASPYIPEAEEEPDALNITQLFVSDHAPVTEVPQDEIIFDDAPTLVDEDFIIEAPAVPEEVFTAEAEEEELFPDEKYVMTGEEIEAAAKAFYEEVSKNFTEDEPDIKDYLREITVTLKSINEKMEKIEKEIEELKK